MEVLGLFNALPMHKIIRTVNANLLFSLHQQSVLNLMLPRGLKGVRVRERADAASQGRCSGSCERAMSPSHAFVWHTSVDAFRMRGGVRYVRVKACSESPSNSEQVPKYSGDWRAFRARLIDNESRSDVHGSSTTGNDDELWAHAVSHYERGCVLIANPEHFAEGRESYFFSDSIVFILEHSQTAGTAGVVLNRCLHPGLGAMDTLRESGLGTEMQAVPLLRSAPLFLGGPVSVDTLLMLHDIENLKGAKKIIDGIYAGGLRDASERLAVGSIDATRLRFFCGYAGWSAGQLQQETEQGVWIVAATHPKIVTEPATGKQDELPRTILRLMGGKYAQMANTFYGTDQDVRRDAW